MFQVNGDFVDIFLNYHCFSFNLFYWKLFCFNHFIAESVVKLYFWNTRKFSEEEEFLFSF